MRGSAAEFESELPFGTVIDALDAYLLTLDSKAVSRLGKETAEVLAEVFPALAEFRNPDREMVVTAERFRIHMAIRELLERLSGRAPLALILDDLHWADQASTELISYLLRRPPQAGILLAISSRTGLLDPSLATALATGRGPQEQITLSPLDLEQLAELTGIPAHLAKAIHDQTGGNPFYTLELTRAGINPSRGQALPGTVAAAISAEMSSLRPGSRRFAEAAAVAGDPFEIDLAALITGEAVNPTGAIDELTSSGLIHPTEVPRRFAFRHPLVRSAIYESVMPGTRLADHEKAAGALADRSAPATEQARHLVLAARPGDREAAVVIGEAATDAQVSAPSLAAEWSDAALRIMPADDTEFHLRILGVKAQATAAISRFQEARAALLQSIGMLRDDEIEARVSITSTCASVEQLLGENETANERLTGLLGDLEKAGSTQALEVTLNLAHDAFLRGDFEDMTTWSVRAMEMAEDQPEIDPGQRAVTWATRALCASFTGPIDVARENADLAAAAFESFDRATIDRNVVGLARLTGAELYLERFEATIRHGNAAIEASRRTGQSQNFPILYPCVGTAGTTTGDFDVAREVLDDAIEGARISNNQQSLAWSLFNRSALALAEGDLEFADELSLESVGICESLEDGLVKTWSGVMRASVIDQSGRPEEALGVLAEAAGGENLEKIPGSWRIGYLLMEVETLVGLERLDDAARICAVAEARAEEFDNAMGRAQALRARSILSLASGSIDEATAKAREAVGLSLGVGASIDAGIGRFALADALREEGNDQLAISELESALAVFAECGASRWQKLAEKKLRALGQKIHRRSGAPAGETGVESLTGREREVAELVVDRRTNREIAEVLFLSQKTVETHLRNIFAKLGVSSRVEVARAIEQQSG